MAPRKSGRRVPTSATPTSSTTANIPFSQTITFSSKATSKVHPGLSSSKIGSKTLRDGTVFMFKSCEPRRRHARHPEHSSISKFDSHNGLPADHSKLKDVPASGNLAHVHNLETVDKTAPVHGQQPGDVARDEDIVATSNNWQWDCGFFKYPDYYLEPEEGVQLDGFIPDLDDVQMDKEAFI